MNKRRRRIQKGRRREEKITARVARWQKMLARRPGARAWRFVVTQEDASTFANSPNTVSIGSIVAREDGTNVVVLSPTESLVSDTLTPYQRSIVERLRSAGQVVVVVDSRYASTRPCDCDPSDDTKGAMNVHSAATGEGR